MKNILIPYDFSETAENALDYAISLFENEHATFILLHVYISKKSKLLNDEYNDDWFDGADDEANISLKKLITSCNKKSEGNHLFRGLVKSNMFIEAVREVVIKEKVDLIITGTEGAYTVSEAFIGTNTLKIINRIKTCPVLIVPYNYSYVPLHQIVFSTNFKRTFKSNEIKPLLHIGFKKQSVIEVVFLSDEQYLTERQKANKTQLEQILDGFDVDFKKIDWIDSETKSLKAHVENTRSEMLAFINHKQNFVSRWTEENVIKKATFQSKIPLLILPEIN